MTLSLAINVVGVDGGGVAVVVVVVVDRGAAGCKSTRKSCRADMRSATRSTWSSPPSSAPRRDVVASAESEAMRSRPKSTTSSVVAAADALDDDAALADASVDCGKMSVGAAMRISMCCNTRQIDPLRDDISATGGKNCALRERVDRATDRR